MKFSVTAIIGALSLGNEVFAAPSVSSIETSLVKRDDPITIIGDAVSTLQTSVQAELKDIAAVVTAADSTPADIKEIKGDLVQIIVAFSTAVSTITPQVAIISKNITVSEIQLLYADAQALNQLLTEIQSEYEQLFATVSSYTLAFIKPLLESAINVAQSLVNSLTSVIPQAATTSGTSGTAAQLQTVSDQSKSTLAGLSNQL